MKTLKLTPKTATKEIVANSLINLKKSDFYLYINEDINLLFYYDKEDNTINVSNEYHFSSSDYYKFNIVFYLLYFKKCCHQCVLLGRRRLCRNSTTPSCFLV